MRIVIFDLQFASYIYHSTPTPSALTMLISGYHKSKGDQVVFTDEEPNFAMYDRVYIVNDQPNLFHLPKWLSYTNVYLIGKYWKDLQTSWSASWDSAPPDNTIYYGWIERWIKKYPKYTKKRLNTFYHTPIKIKQFKNIFSPEGAEYLIIDQDWESWDFNCEIMKSLNIDKIYFLYPINLEGRVEEVFSLIKQKNISREGLWLNLPLITNLTELQPVLTLWKKYKLGRTVRLKTHVEARNQDEWEQLIPQIFGFLKQFREQCKKRIFIEPHGIEFFAYPRILKELKRWTGKDMGYAKNSLFDYMLFDGCRDTQDLIDFLIDPYTYIQKKRIGSNKFIELVPFIEQYPNLMWIISDPVNGSAV